MKDDLELLDLMLGDMATRDTLYRPDTYWDQINLRLEETVRRYGVTELRSSAHPIFRHFGASNFQDLTRISSLYSRYAHSPLVRLLRALPLSGKLVAKIDGDIERAVGNEHEIISRHIKVIYDLAEEIDPDSLALIEDTLQGSPEYFIVRNGRSYTAECLSYFVNLRRATQDIDLGDAPRFLEIGGGYGGLCDVAAHLWERSTYVIVDIPHTGYCSTQYLKARFGERVVDYRRTRELDNISLDDIRGRVAVICPWQLDAVSGQFDMFFNFCSFQEMSPAIVENYARKIRTLVRGGNAVISCKVESHPVTRDPIRHGVSEPIDSSNIREIFRDFDLIWAKRHEAIPYYDGPYETIRFSVPDEPLAKSGSLG